MKKWSWLLLSLLAGWYFFQTPTSERLQLPSLHHFMGTDFLGRDLLGRTMQAMTFSLALGILSALAAFSLGGFLGFWAGYLGGSIETLFSLVLDFFYVIPYHPFGTHLHTHFRKKHRSTFYHIDSKFLDHFC